MLVAMAKAEFIQLNFSCCAPSVSSWKSNSSTGLFLPYGYRPRKRGMANPMYLESSDSRRERHGAYSGVPKILVRSRGLASSCQLPICIRDGDAPAINGQ